MTCNGSKTLYCIIVQYGNRVVLNHLTAQPGHDECTLAMRPLKHHGMTLRPSRMHPSAVDAMVIANAHVRLVLEECAHDRVLYVSRGNGCATLYKPPSLTPYYSSALAAASSAIAAAALALAFPLAFGFAFACAGKQTLPSGSNVGAREGVSTRTGGHADRRTEARMERRATQRVRANRRRGWQRSQAHHGNHTRDNMWRARAWPARAWYRCKA